MPYAKKNIKKKPYKKVPKRYIPRKVYRKKAAPSVPFGLTKSCKMLYKNTSATLTPGAVYGSQRFRLTDMYDFDYDNNFGNKQPLYFDTLVTGSGPYRSFRVHAWKISFKIVNLSATAVTVYWQNGTINGSSDNDIQSEIQNMPRVKSLQLTPATGSKSIGYISAFGTTKGVLGRKPDDVYEGTWTASPSNVVIGTLGYMATDGVTTTAQIVCEVSCVQYVTLFNRDALVS